MKNKICTVDDIRVSFLNFEIRTTLFCLVLIFLCRNETHRKMIKIINI